MNAVLTDDEIGILLTAAVHAPSIHNTQPWRFEVHGPVIDVLLDEERMLSVEDPSGRAAHIGVGAAALNVRVAAAMLGHESRLAVHPDPARQEVTARIFLANRNTPICGLSSLYGEVTRRHTYRGPLLDHPIPPQVRRQLDDAASAEGARLQWLDAGARNSLRTVLRQTDDLELHDEDRLHERHSWVGGDRSRDGVPQNALGPSPVRPALVRDLDAGFDETHRSQAVFETDPAIVVLTTRAEDATAWVQAGAALQRALLVATSYDLAASFLDQLLEHPGPRYQVRDLIGGRPWPQLVIRIGYPAQSNSHPGRRDWRDSFDQWF
ncbi:Acg family FMN-binding oxidoreductase [Kribbella sp. NPDC051586]|uniref:Acg family FMN-binding oxidoreductase n=1 Tax=Kribbella sp. NPDC051586 TaxID=3364118 RepID=UPI0037AACA06